MAAPLLAGTGLRSAVCGLLALLLATAYVAIFENFTTRLRPSDFFVYGDQFTLLWDHLDSAVVNFTPLFFLVVSGFFAGTVSAQLERAASPALVDSGPGPAVADYRVCLPAVALQLRP